ncbi:uncharacterized peptidase C1-like protein F26E4.3 [Acanthaster planci]|uniref:Uncharacterized peptidase C1-like protein F26E4.3 n=1 Tax=Acanthaster planci TaxID=133434 RepID=A0A8B7YBE7_ACAPL|nr:uncharacterized peptidase C1-like protein F26E4.3 [Acanthaster planci]XP_022089030.1 uncharacterized peptidase C1-like protein F26E4.3 [Acanthaster planci]XP_022089039.1 uncharacterized peptidase C1-like protein F26E4.3 [Acanthaster planci]XP_022089048.1 uncharacterized peptidase C1-like protein F26E4.3 [Acanthaster planci]XP_022089057.1 uncharacterized peptidase C1-like protein F26E4.3 [Acanthaster planci]
MTRLSSPGYQASLFLLPILLVILLLCVAPSTARYCEERECCIGRDDDCHMPYPALLPSTRCYCDQFCNRTQTDCCPDFWGYCLGIEPPVPIVKGTCCHDGQDIEEGKSIKVNCNRCYCKKLLYGFYGFDCEAKVCLVQPEVAERVNVNEIGWTAGNYSEFWGMTLAEGFQFRLGTMKPTAAVKAMNEIQMDAASLDIPEEFDARDKWPSLRDEVLNQGDCASSWALSTASVASDRLAIQSNGTIAMALSPQHLLSCNIRRQQGCHGGHLDRAWWYLRKKGVVTTDCYPYKSGMSFDMKMDKGSCYIRGEQSNSCPKERQTSDRYFSTPPYRISEDEEEIKAEILMNGPVQAAFHVQEDFFMYKFGVYKHSKMATKDEQKASGWHSVKLLGWGVDKSQGKPIKYWLAANSWGKGWGEDGHFRILRGKNECQIESFVVGVWGKVDSDMINGNSVPV